MKKDKYIIGYDPGAKGGFVVFKNGKIYKKRRFPMIGKEVDYEKLKKFLKPYRKRDTTIYFEKIHSRGGGWGASQSFNFGRVTGIAEGVIRSFDISFVEVPAVTWQKVSLHGITPHFKQASVKGDGVKKGGRKTKKVRDTKKMGLIAVKRLFPKTSFVPKGCKVPNEGLIDAALIGYYGVLRHGHDKI